MPDRNKATEKDKNPSPVSTLGKVSRGEGIFKKIILFLIFLKKSDIVSTISCCKERFFVNNVLTKWGESCTKEVRAIQRLNVEFRQETFGLALLYKSIVYKLTINRGGKQ